MAELASTRSNSRRTTPQPAAAPARTTRTTRSQSREISDGEVLPTGPKARRKGAPISSENANNPADHSLPNRKGITANPSNALQDLSTVHENSSIVYPDLHDNGDGEGAQDVEIGGTAQGCQSRSNSPRRISAFSGTTARTSESAQELSYLNSESMMDALEGLSRCSDKILRFFIPSEISNASISAFVTQLQTKGSQAKKTSDRLNTMFSLEREMYGSGSYIAHQKVVEALFDKSHIADVDIGPWRPEVLLQKANLAVLASNMISHSWQGWDIQFMGELEQIFPKPFVTGFEPSQDMQAGRSILITETFRTALEIRTQYAVVLLAHHAAEPNFDSDEILQQVFYKDSRTLRGWNVTGLHSEDLTEEIEEAVISRLQELRDSFANSEDTASGIRFLQRSFPWMDLVQQVISWTSQRLRELDNQIIANGGFGRIFEALNDEIQKTRKGRLSVKDEGISRDCSPQIVLDYNPPTEAPNTVPEPQDRRNSTRTRLLNLGPFDPNSPKAKAAVASIKRVEARRKAAPADEEPSRQQDQPEAPDIQVSATAPSTSAAATFHEEIGGPSILSSAPAQSTDRRAAKPQHDHTWRMQEGDDEIVALRPITKDELRGIGLRLGAIVKQRQAESNKENIEMPLSQAEPLPRSGQKRRFIDPQPNAERVQWDGLEGSNSNPPSSQIENISSGEEFEQLIAPTNPSNQRRSKFMPKHSDSQTVGSQGPSPKKARVQVAGSSSKPQIVPEGANDEPPPSQALINYRIANSRAKERKIVREQKAPKPPQSRTAWSDDETEQLLTLIEEHGISWTLLMHIDEKEGGLLQSRGQVGLKDKARNIKVDFLRAGNVLPKHFDRIPISKIQIERLNDVGIRYDPETGQRVDARVD